MRERRVIEEANMSRDFGDIELRPLAQQRTSIEVASGQLNIFGR
jgi:hypothetical protein